MNEQYVFEYEFINESPDNCQQQLDLLKNLMIEKKSLEEKISEIEINAKKIRNNLKFKTIYKFTRKNLNKRSKDLPLEQIKDHSNFSFPYKTEFSEFTLNKATYLFMDAHKIIFIDDDGTEKILKNRDDIK